MKKFLFWTTIIIVIALLLYGTYVFTERKSLFSMENVLLQWQGPHQLTWGKETTFKLSLKNNNKIALESPVVSFSVPEAYKIISPEQKKVEFEKINAGSQKEISLRVVPFGKKEATNQIKAEVRFLPQNITTSFTKKVGFKTTISKVPVKIGVKKEEFIAAGSNINYEVKITNQTQQPVQNLRISLFDIKGLKEQEFVPQPDIFPSAWTATTLAPREQKVIYLKGEVGDKQKLAFTVLAQAQNQQGVIILSKQKKFTQTIGPSPLVLSLSIEDQKPPYTAKPGDELLLSIKAQNTTNTTLKDLGVTTTLEGNLLPYARFTLKQKGKKIGNQIKWESDTVPSLKALPPDSEINLALRIKIESDIPVTPQTTNLSLGLTTEIICKNPPSVLDSEVLSSTQKIKVKLQGGLLLHPSLDHLSGPLPLQLNKKTTFRVDLSLIASYNDIGELKVTTIVPQEVVWENTLEPEYENIRFDAQSQTVTWEIDNLLAGTGHFSPVRQASFVVSITPQTKKSQYFITGELTARGIDQFTNQPVRAYENALYTNHR